MSEDRTPYPTVYPALRYRDAPKAIRWLGEAFGLTEHLVVPGEEGKVAHAELRSGLGLVMLGSTTDGSDGRLAEPQGPAGVYVVVEDVETHYRRAQEAGAEIVLPLTGTDYGSREYTAKDLEGNLWSFGTYQPFAAGA